MSLDEQLEQRGTTRKKKKKKTRRIENLGATGRGVSTDLDAFRGLAHPVLDLADHGRGRPRYVGRGAIVLLEEDRVAAREVVFEACHVRVVRPPEPVDALVRVSHDEDRRPRGARRRPGIGGRGAAMPRTAVELRVGGTPGLLARDFRLDARHRKREDEIVLRPVRVLPFVHEDVPVLPAYGLQDL